MMMAVSSSLLVILFLLVSIDIECIRAEAVTGARRVKLPGQYGIIRHPINGIKYGDNEDCVWFLEGNSSTRLIQLKFSYYEIECLWDRLFVYSGGSLYEDIFASVTGTMNMAAEDSIPLALPFTDDEGSGSGNGSNSGYTPTVNELIVTVPGPSAFVYFFSDKGETRRGFNLSYWINGCIEGCSNNGICNETTGACQCEPMWTGQYCQYWVCPSHCSGHGHCDYNQKKCVCSNEYTGHDCSIMKGSPHWSLLEGSDIIGRAGHTSVKWGDYVWVYGGYRYGNSDDIMSSGSGFDYSSQEFIRYNVISNEWEEVPIESIMYPSARYSHTAVVYNDSMYIYGGALVTTEDIVNEFWKFDFTTLQWTLLNPAFTNNTNSTITQFLSTFTMTTDHTHYDYLPLPVKYHTANVINDTMIVLFGYSVTSETIINYIQRYDFVSNQWSISVPLSDASIYGRIGHTSVYVPALDSLLIHGGGRSSTQKVIKLDSLVSYSLTTNYWDVLSPGPVPVMFHSSILLTDGLLISYGGSSNDDCVSEDIVLYNILCNEWAVVDVPTGGSPLLFRRFGHTLFINDSRVFSIGGYNGGIMYNDMAVFEGTDCSIIEDSEACINDSFCMWNGNQCIGISLQAATDNVELSCEYDPCSIYHGCISCTSSNHCQWNLTTSVCTSLTTPVVLMNGTATSTDQCNPIPSSHCSNLNDCIRCQVNSSCTWINNVNGSYCTKTYDEATPTSCDVLTSCLRYTACSDCNKGCLWCDSTQKCINDNIYPESFPYGQCREWSNGCLMKCSDYNTCDSCHGDARCGWCRDPADTGLGTCAEGGYYGPLETSTCPQMSHWFYEECPLCNCNGHSRCINESTSECEQCADFTTGDTCENCVTGFYGKPLNGNNCSVCDCNGYNSTCNTENGTCICRDAGVTGDMCRSCDGLGGYIGDADNFCHYKMSVGFIYTFRVTESRQKQTFYTAVPRNGDRLNVKFDITRNDFNAEISVQFFIGKVSQNYLLLVNLTEPIKVSGRNHFSKTFEPFSTDLNMTNFFTFANPSLQKEANFSQLLDSSFPNDYTKGLWNGDLGLVIFVNNQSAQTVYKITIDQNNLIFLAYFFVTFVICFALLLGIFLLGWFIKRKIEMRAIIRAQHVEMQRRVRRPFARVKAIVEKKPDLKAKQSASYVSVETCKDNKAAILSLLIRLPGDRERGVPSVNRSGIGFGSTLVRMNQSSKSKKSRTDRHRRGSSTLLEDEHST